MNSELNGLLNKVDEWSKKDRKVYILTTPDMVDDLELVVLKHLAGNCSSQIAMATAGICVTTPERMAVREMTVSSGVLQAGTDRSHPDPARLTCNRAVEG